MALSGSVSTGAYTTSAGNKWTVVLSWTATQNAINNTSTISWNIKVDYSASSTSSWVTIGEVRATINETEVFYRDTSARSSGYKGTQIASGTITVNHSSTGEKSVDMKIEAGIYVWAISQTGSTTFTLDTIDRTAPTVSCSTSNITSAGFKIAGTSNVTADIWQYSLDNGSTWTQFSTTAGTSASITLTSLSPNTTYNVKVRARKKSNQVYGTSAVEATKTLGASVINSTTSFAADVASPVCKFSLTVYDANYYHRLTIKKGTTTVFTVNLGKLAAGTATRSYTLTADERSALLAAFPDNASYSMNLLIATFSDSGYTTLIGSEASATVTVTTSSTVSAPTFPGFAYLDYNSTTAGVTGNDQVLIKGLSTLRVLCTAGTAKNGATIKSYSASIGSASATSTTTTISVGTISSYGSLTLTVTCTDSRGYSTKLQTTVTVLNYANPKLSSYKLRRKDEIEGLVQLSFSGTRSAIKADGTTDTNSLVYVRYRYKKTNEDTYSAYTSILASVTSSGTSFSFASLELLELDTEISYDFHLQIRDKLGSTTSFDLYLVLPQGSPVVSLRKRNSTYNFPRVGVNNPAPKYPLDVGGSIAMNGYLVLGYVKDLTNENFNTLNAGIYYYSGSGCTNAPATSPGFLEAITNGTAILQRYTTLAGAVLCRGYDGSVWTAWA